MSDGDNSKPADGKAINWHTLSFAPYEYKDILKVKVTQEFNEHAKLTITLILHDSAKDYVQTADENTSVALKYTDSTGSEQILFKGVVTNIRQCVIGGLKGLAIEAYSFSYLLDVKKISRSFQRDGEPYSYIFARINDGAREYVPNLTGDVISAEDRLEDAPTQCFVMQYKESDFTFLKRLASHFNLGIVPDVTFDSPKVYFGMPPQKKKEKDEQEETKEDKQEEEPVFNVSAYRILRDTEGYAKASANTRKNSGTILSENDFTYCEAQSLDVLRLGQKVTFMGMAWYVKKIYTAMEKGAGTNIYILTTEQGLMQDDMRNPQIIGVSLHGIVKTVTKDMVQVHITEIDDAWDEGTTWYFPYVTVYSSPDGSGWYFMPEIGDNVRIYFSNNIEEAGVAISSINLTPSKRGRREDPDTKILSNVYGKQIILTPGGIQIISNGNLLMTLTDAGGVTIKSDKKIIFEAKDNIEITSTASKVLVSANDEISLKQGSSEINIQSDIKITGNKVKIQP